MIVGSSITITAGPRRLPFDHEIRSLTKEQARRVLDDVRLQAGVPHARRKGGSAEGQG